VKRDGSGWGPGRLASGCWGWGVIQSRVPFLPLPTTALAAKLPGPRILVRAAAVSSQRPVGQLPQAA